MATERGRLWRRTIGHEPLAARQFGRRHTAVTSILAAHLPLLLGAAVVSRWSATRTVVWVGLVALLVVAAVDGRRTQLHRSVVATLGLLTCSAMIVQLADGPMESGFHVFVVVAIIAWYESPAPFAVTVLWTLLHHGVVGAVAPTTLHEDASHADRPWAWAALQSLQVGLAIVAAVTAWQFAQDGSRRSRRLLAATHDGVYGRARDGRITFANRAAVELTGRAERDVVGGRDHSVFGHPDDGPDCCLCAELRDGPVELLESRLRVGEGTVAVELSSRDLPGADEQSAVTIRDVTARRRSEAELRRLALEDPLTGLANRARLMDRLEEALARTRRHRRVLAVVLLDLDHFKDVNDTFGHETGDQLLCEVADRLVAEVRDVDTVSRLGGDEFVIVLDDTDRAAAVDVVGRVRRSLTQPYGVALGAPAIDVSIGVRMIADGGIGAEQAVADADIAMYRSKRAGRGRVTVFDADLGATTRRDVRLGAELEEAIDRGQLRLLFQPMFDERTLVMRGVEALVRWEHPTEGLLLPEAFVPQAEKMRLVGRLGTWVLEEAWARLARWQQQGTGLSVSINVSRSQLKDRQIVRHVHRLLVEQPADPRLLWLEITESSVADTTPLHDEVLAELRGLGIRLAVDDFGTGESSLAALSDLAVDAVKVDRRFVTGVDVDDRKARLLDAVLAMAGALGLRTVTEGVETVRELEQVRRSGPTRATRYVQGHLLGEPVPASAIGDRLLAGEEGRRARVADRLITPGR